MKSIQKTIIIIVLGLMCFSVKAQSYSHAPNDTLISYTSLDAQVTMNITQVHTGNDTLQFQWNLNSVDMPVEWEANICDNSQCYDSLVLSGMTLPILPGDNGLMLVHCIPHVTSGTAVIRYAMCEITNPTQVDTLTWIIHTSEAGIDSQIACEFPVFNYASGHLVLNVEAQELDELRMYNSLGQLVLFEKVNGQSHIKLSKKMSGVYWLQLLGKGQVINKKIYITP